MHKKKKIGKALQYLTIYVFLVISLFPVYWMFLSSFRDNSELLTFPPKFLPIGGNLLNYAMTLSIAASLPVLFIFIFLQKYMISGLTTGTVKG